MLVASLAPVNPHRDFFSSRVLPGFRRCVRFLYLQLPGRGHSTCGDEGNRTPDLLLAKQALYQLSYIPEPCAANHVRVLGFEPRTSALSELRSSQLSYTRLSFGHNFRCGAWSCSTLIKCEGQTDLVWPPPNLWLLARAIRDLAESVLTAATGESCTPRWVGHTQDSKWMTPGVKVRVHVASNSYQYLYSRRVAPERLPSILAPGKNLSSVAPWLYHEAVLLLESTRRTHAGFLTRTATS